MKVLHVNNVANVPDGLVKGLRKLGIDAELYQPYTGVNRNGALGKLSVVTNRIADAQALKQKIRSESYDIVHIHYAYFGILGILGGYRYWLHCHGTDIRRNLYRPAFKNLTAACMNRAERVFYSTPDLKVHADTVRSDAVFLPNPIQTELFEPKPLDGVHNKVLLISRIDPVKGIDAAFTALEKLKERNPAIEIDAFAWGPDVARFKEKAFVNFIAPVAHSDIAALIPRYQVILGQFELGIMGMSEMEAMACARPVISDFTYQNWYAEAPPLVQAKTPDEIVAETERLIADPKLCEETGTAGRDWVVKYHDYISVAERLAKAYADYCGI